MYTKKHKLHLIFGITASATAYCVSIMPHTIFLNKLENVVSFYRNGAKVRVNNKIKNMCQEVMNELKLSTDERSLIKPFHVFGFETFNAGTLNNKSGGIIGIPINFTYEDPLQVPSAEIIVNHQPVNVFMKEKDHLTNALVLSENAQKYAIAHEILRIKNKEVYKSACGLSFSILIATLLYNRIVHKFNLYQKKRQYRFMLLACSIIIGISSWLAYKDIISCQLDNSIDESISKLGSNYIEGGKEFYEKLLQRNVALRELMGDDGKKLFSINGNMEYFLRQKSMPLTHRKDFFERKLQNVHTVV